MEYTNSPLADCKVMSPNHSGKRTHTIDRITPHCLVGQAVAERIGEIFTKPSREASCNYGIGTEGRVCLIVDEVNRSWCTSSNENDQRAITIECASDSQEPYAFNDNVYNKLIDLCEDICKRNGKTKLLWFGNKDKTLNYKPASNEMILTVHRWFANKSCPGNWMYARMGDLANKVTARLNNTSESDVLYCVQVGAYSKKKNAEIQLEKVKAAGFDAFITTKTKINTNELKIGDKVKLQEDAPVYGKTIKFNDWVYQAILFVREIDDDKVIVSTVESGPITGSVDKKYLTKI